MEGERDQEAIDRLPDLYARALRMVDQGLPSAEIARRLGLEIWAVGPMLEVAELKLAEQTDTIPGDDSLGAVGDVPPGLEEDRTGFG